MEKQETQHLLDEEFEVEYHPNYLPTFLDELGLHYAIPRTKRSDRPENAEEILDERVEYAFDEEAHDAPHNKSEDDEDEDIRTDGGQSSDFSMLRTRTRGTTLSGCIRLMIRRSPGRC